MQLVEMRARVAQRLNEGGGSIFYPSAEIDLRLNEANRFFCLLTLALEKTTAILIPAATPFFHLLPLVSDLIVPLRLSTVGGTKIRPATIEQMTAANSGWIATPGTPAHYAVEGCDLMAVDKQPAAPLAAIFTYARAPLPLVGDGDTPEIPERLHPLLVGYAVYSIRLVEGAQEWQKSLPLFGEFLAGAATYADYISNRNQAQGYDAMPPELAPHDLAKLLKFTAAPKVAA